MRNKQIIPIGIIILIILIATVSGCVNSTKTSANTTVTSTTGQTSTAHISKLVIGTTNVPDDINIEDSNFQRFS